ncbi:hypothetical protein PQ472_04830 [Lacticaseibacillus pabuli]|uniref:Lipoprotein n=1 Tax=Lacticaseibacillus pabuli TaxID=3025672 RepID=A0ABY7WTT0_9LACO|nr:hypothetical protein [Lacticaseibacillus sp. KACC 23028]WDF83562.1 hypothetical protein PQ472_04830 [Lacticaseibacillus sp. KACC 23028]
MKKVVVATAVAMGTMMLAACGSQSTAKPAKSLTITSGLKDGKIKDDMADVRGKASGYKYVGYGVNGSIMDVSKVKNGKWHIEANDDGSVDTAYIFGSNKKPDEYDDFHAGDYKKVKKLAFSDHAQDDAKAYSSSSSAEDASSSSKAAQKKAAENYYSPNYSYDQLVRTPDKFDKVKMQFSGQVFQVASEKTSRVNLLVALNGDTDQLVYIQYKPSLTHGVRILEDDNVTFYGKYWNTYTYETTNGDDSTVPAFMVDKIVDHTTK